MTDLGARQRLELELILLVNSTPRQPDDHVCSCDVIPDLVHLCRNPTYLTKYLFTYERLCSFGGNTPTPCFHRCRRKLRNCNKVSLHFRSHKKQPPFIDPYGPHLSTTNDCVVYWCIQYCNCELRAPSKMSSASVLLLRKSLLSRHCCLLVRTIATHTSTRPKATHAMVQATNLDVETSFIRPKQQNRESEAMRKFRRLSGVASAHNDDTNEDLLVDMVALEKLASQKPTPVRLKDMQLYACSPSDSKQRLRNAQFLHKELPIRMAQRAMDLLTLPHGLNETIAVRNVASIYLKYIEMFQNTPPPTNMKEEAEFTDMLQNIILDRQTIPTSIAKGIASWYESNKDIDPEHLQEMENALYRFFTARVGLRFLTQHHILSDVNRTPAGPLEYAKTNLGCIQVDFDPVEEIKNVIDQVTRQTIDCYGCCPEIELVDSSIVDKKKKKSGFTYVPHHLQFMVTELLKNSCRATVDKYYGEDKMPRRMSRLKCAIKAVVLHAVPWRRFGSLRTRRLLP